MRLEGKVALITGGAAGIGRATAERFAEEGASVVLCDLNEAAGVETADALGEAATFYRVNTADRGEVQAWVDEVVANFGRIDILINNAGITRDATLVKVKNGELVKQMSEEQFDLVIDVNLQRCIQLHPSRCTDHDSIKKSGVIISAILDCRAWTATFGQTNYVASKAGVIGMTKGVGA